MFTQIQPVSTDQKLLTGREWTGASTAFHTRPSTKAPEIPVYLLSQQISHGTFHPEPGTACGCTRHLNTEGNCESVFSCAERNTGEPREFLPRSHSYQKRTIRLASKKFSLCSLVLFPPTPTGATGLPSPSDKETGSDRSRIRWEARGSARPLA